jgi:hypothetical protein
MRRFSIWTMLIGLVAIAGCQTTEPVQQRGKYCSYRSFDAGACDQPTNFLLFEFLIGRR